MSRVLLVCPEPLGHRHPAGVGIRFIEFARALVADGHEVTVLSPDGGDVPGCRVAEVHPAAIRDASHEADVAIVQGHAANDFTAHARSMPTVVDLYDPFIIENFSYHQSHGEQVFEHDHATLLRSLDRGDFFLCASSAQRFFYLGLLLGAKRLNPDVIEEDPRARQLLAIVPFGVPESRPAVERNPEGARLLFGGIYDWYDPLLAIDAVSIARERLPNLTLTFTSHPNPETTPQGMAKKARDLAHKIGSGFVQFLPWVAYEERGAFYDQFTAALLTFPGGIETDLAMRTRIFDYLWASLPVISSPAPGTDELIERYQAGIVVRSTSPSEVADNIVTLLTNRTEFDAAVDGGRRYAGDHGWDRLLEPLLHFCRNPRIDPFRKQKIVAQAARPLLRRIRNRIGGRS